MDKLVFACIAPHGWLLLPFIGGVDSLKARSSQLAMQEMGKRIAEIHPETLVVMTPHGLKVEDRISILDTPVVKGSIGGESPLQGTQHSFELQFNTDRDFNTALAKAAQEQNLPVARVTNDLPWNPLPLDFGAAIPLWFLGTSVFPQPKVVIICGRPVQDWGLFPSFGKAILQVIRAAGKRVAFIASADMGHAHDPKHEYGFDPASREYDQAVVKAIQQNDLCQLSSFDPDWVQRAKTDSYAQLLTLAGILSEQPMKSELLSYEVPTYFGMLCAAWTPG